MRLEFEAIGHGIKAENGPESSMTKKDIELLVGFGLGAGKFARAKVPGGWLVLFRDGRDHTGGFEMCFYPDATHCWDGGSVA